MSECVLQKIFFNAYLSHLLDNLKFLFLHEITIILQIFIDFFIDFVCFFDFTISKINFFFQNFWLGIENENQENFGVASGK